MKEGLFSDRNYNLWMLLAHTRQAMLKARRKELQYYNIRPGRALIIFLVHALRDKATLSELSRWCFQETHSVSELLTRMEREGLVKKVKDMEGKSRVTIELTEKGRKAYRQSMKRESINDIITVLSEEERQQLTLYLQKLRIKALEQFGIDHRRGFLWD